MRHSSAPDHTGEMKIGKLQRQLDVVDRELLQLLETKVELLLRLAKLRGDRDKAWKEIDGLIGRSAGLIKPDFIQSIFKSIEKESRRLQKSNIKLVGFQGEHGAYGEVASRTLAPDSAYIPCMEFADVFDGVRNGLFDIGVVPVENSLEGAVTQVNDLLTTTSLKVTGEVTVRINHCLLVPPGTQMNEIRIVYSHPQALAQCRRFILQNRLEARPFYDTAGAAKMIDRNRPLATAAIASSLSAELYGLEILKAGIEDEDSNCTRFQQIARMPYDGEGEKCSTIFAVTHESGALQSVLEIFSEANINMTRIASTPRKGDPGNYTFFCDFEGSDRDPKIKAVLEQLERRSKQLSFLGCYPKCQG